MKNIPVIGLGKVSSLVGTLLHDIFTVTGVDVKAPAHFAVAAGNNKDHLLDMSAIDERIHLRWELKTKDTAVTIPW